MRAVLIDTPGSVRVDDWPDPVLPGSTGAIVKVTAAAICGSDLHFYEGDYPLFQPLSLGHEAIGTVVEVGSDVRTVKVGDQVIVSSVAGCGVSWKCMPKRVRSCVSRNFSVGPSTTFIIRSASRWGASAAISARAST